MRYVLFCDSRYAIAEQNMKITLNTKSSIERNGLFTILKTEVF